MIFKDLFLLAPDVVFLNHGSFGATPRPVFDVYQEWQCLLERQPVQFIVTDLPDHLENARQVLGQLWQGVTSRTKVIFMSHITSPTALCLPVTAVCALAREAGILTIIDGAHTLGQMTLDLNAIGADFYTSNAHKWLCAPKGSAFLYARPEVQDLLDPLVVGWGWQSEKPSNSLFIDHHQWLGTNDVSAYLSVPAAIAFQTEHNWIQVRQQCHELAGETMGRICDLTGLAAVYPATTDFFQQMFVAPLPPVDIDVLKRRLYAEYRVEAPVLMWNGRYFIRVSVQAYNGRSDMDVLLTALADLLPQVRLAQSGQARTQKR